MRKNTAFKITGIILSLALFTLSFVGCSKKTVTENEILLDDLGEKEYVQQRYDTMAEKVRKEETVYVNLTQDGKVKQVNVTDWLHTDTPQTKIQDLSPLSDIRNIKTLATPQTDGEYLYWDMDTTDIYYSGVSSSEPPVKISIKYYLDDVEMSAQDIAGKSGNIKIVIKADNTLKKTVKIEGQDCTISCPMILAGGMIMKDNVFKNITVDNGTTVSDGAKQIVFFVGIPGIDESLGLSSFKSSLIDKSVYSDSYTISATAENFELGNIMFAVMPFSSLGSFGNGSLPDSVDELKNILSDIESVQTALTSLDLNRIIDLLYGDSNKIESMMGAVEEAVTIYSENEKLIKTFGKYMTDENIAKLNRLASDLDNADLEQISKTLNDPAIMALLDVLPQLSSSLSGVSAITKDLNDIIPVLQAMSQDMKDPEIQTSVDNLPQTLERLKKVLDTIDENKEIIEVIGDLSSENSSAKLDAIMNTAEKYSNLGDMTDAETKTLAGRIKEWLSFGESYDIFTQKADKTESSVLFTYKTDAISLPVQASASVETSENAGFIQRIKNLFK